ncbi:MAG: restriction endonuclease [Actinomycetota bacterium]|nr:restriction endonuclease [Actinomycetota bacterium]
MDLEPLSRLIEGADFLSFREIALQYLSLKGYRDVELKDGWNDGGSDFAVGVLSSNPLSLGIQITVQRANWESKAKADARRVKAELGIEDVVFVTSRRIAQAVFSDVAEELWVDGIRIRSVDSQAIASFFFAEGTTGIVLRALGIRTDARRPEAVGRPELSEDAAYAFAFFGNATTKFRRSVIEQTVSQPHYAGRGRADA